MWAIGSHSYTMLYAAGSRCSSRFAKPMNLSYQAADSASAALITATVVNQYLSTSWHIMATSQRQPALHPIQTRHQAARNMSPRSDTSSSAGARSCHWRILCCSAPGICRTSPELSMLHKDLDTLDTYLDPPS
jgi:hypothetical protein